MEQVQKEGREANSQSSCNCRHPVSAEVMNVCACPGAGPLVNPYTLNFRDCFSDVDQLIRAQLSFAPVIEISPPAHLCFPVVGGQQLSEQLVGFPAQAKRSDRIVISYWIRNLI